MRRCLIFLSVFSVLSFVIEPVFAGAWAQRRAEGFYKVGLKFIRASRMYNRNGDRVSIPKVGDYSWAFQLDLKALL